MISYAEASELVAAAANLLAPAHVVRVPIGAALYRLLATDLVAREAMPSFDYSAMDGIAVSWRETDTAWPIVGEIAAGALPGLSLGKGQAVVIMTGAPLAPGSDTVIPSEDIHYDGPLVRLKPGTSVKKGQHVRLRGEEISEGAKLLTRGTKMMPQHIALAAACGYASVLVYDRLKIGVLATGSELVDVREIPPPGKIRASNLATLIALITHTGHEPLDLGLVSDNSEILSDRLAQHLAADMDILLTTGGVCDGRYDLLPDIFAKIGVKTRFRKVRMKPGKSLLFGEYVKAGKPKLIFGLPGNPVSAFVCCHRFLESVFSTLLDSSPPAQLRAALTTEVYKDDDKRHFLRGRLFASGNGAASVTPMRSQSSSDLGGLALANCLIVLEEDQRHLQARELVTCIMI